MTLTEVCHLASVPKLDSVNSFIFIQHSGTNKDKMILELTELNFGTQLDM